VTLCCPLLYGLHITHLEIGNDGTLERGTDVNPAPARDGVMTSDQRSTSPPSPLALCDHPHRYATIPSTAVPSPALWEPRMIRHHHAHCYAPSGLSSAAPSSQRTDGDQNGKLPHSHPRSRSWAGTGLATTLDRSEIRQDDHQLHDTVHHAAICSLRTMQYDCKPPPLGL
jgi:hypothetical protein